MNRRLVVVLFLLLTSSSLAVSSYADVSLGLGYPYVGLRYDFIPQLSAEARYAAGEGINLVAGRGYWNFYQNGGFNFFTGLEAGVIGFDAMEMKGNGAEYGLFLGGEYRIIPALGVALDVAPTIITLHSQEYSNNGLEWVVNAAIYWHVF